MKTFSAILGLAGLLLCRAHAQVSVEVTLDQEQFLPGETLLAGVRIVNSSGQPLHFGTDTDWLKFTVESVDGPIVIKYSEPPVLGEFDVQSSQMATKRVDLAPYFELKRSGRYRITATVHIKEWSASVSSAPKGFDVIRGSKLWSQDFGVPLPAGTTNQMPELRKYSLVQANYLKSQLRLYVLVSDPLESQVFKVKAIGGTTSFSRPEAQVDRQSDLHLLWQNGAATFSYTVLNPSGEIIRQETYDYVDTHPRLRPNDAGEVSVYGGVRELKPGQAAAANRP
jgi:hypothetical protein